MVWPVCASASALTLWPQALPWGWHLQPQVAVLSPKVCRFGFVWKRGEKSSSGLEGPSSAWAPLVRCLFLFRSRPEGPCSGFVQVSLLHRAEEPTGPQGAHPQKGNSPDPSQVLGCLSSSPRCPTCLLCPPSILLMEALSCSGQPLAHEEAERCRLAGRKRGWGAWARGRPFSPLWSPPPAAEPVGNHPQASFQTQHLCTLRLRLRRQLSA